MSHEGKMRIGISGWSYAPWRGKFYPDDLPHKNELNYAAERFGSIEVNGTFYGLQTPKSFTGWARAVPDDFCFAVKGSRYITHMLRLKDPKTPLANFFASGPLALGHKLGPILWQFPPQMKFDPERFGTFLGLLPKTTAEASALARRHDDRLKARAHLKSDVENDIRHAVEIRNDSFCTPEFVDLLKAHNVALVVADTVDWPLVMDMTADFVYCRLHGSEELYASGYDDDALDTWARRVARWAQGGEPSDAKRIGAKAEIKKSGRDVYVYFDNDMKVRAPADALGLMERLKLKS